MFSFFCRLARKLNDLTVTFAVFFYIWHSLEDNLDADEYAIYNFLTCLEWNDDGEGRRDVLRRVVIVF